MRVKGKSALAILTAVGCIGLLLASLAYIANAEAQHELLGITLHTISRTQALNTMRSWQQPTDADVTFYTELVGRWQEQATNAKERKVIADLLQFPWNDVTHRAERQAALQAATLYYHRALDAQSQRAHERSFQATLALGGGIGAAVLALLGVLLVGLRSQEEAAEEAHAAGMAEAAAAAAAEPGTEFTAEKLQDMLRQRLEELYATRVQIREADKFVVYGEIAAGISHELKSSLAAIRAAAQVVQAKLPQGDSAAKQLDGIIAEVDAARERVQNYLARPTSSESMRELHPKDLIRDLSRTVAELLRQRGVGWSTAVADDVPMVRVDPMLLHVGLRNLVDNAAYASKPGSCISVSVRSAEPPARAGLYNAKAAPGSWVEIAIADQGPGLQAVGGESTKPGGSGVGIPVTRQLVQRFGGALEFDAQEGVGTTARVFLPAAQSVGGSTGTIERSAS